MLFLAQQAELNRLQTLDDLGMKGSKLDLLHFDEMESFERSKCLPLSIPMVVVPSSRKILSFRVAVMPAKGLLAAVSRKKYGFREDERAQKAGEVFEEIRSVVAPSATIRTDQNPQYPSWIRPHFPTARHETIKGSRGCAVGQGELKRVRFDPLFGFNHSAAMLRANINRLVRRTWSTTKRPERLAAHIALYVHYHNSMLTEPSVK